MSDPPPPVTLATLTAADFDAFEAALTQAVELYDLDRGAANVQRVTPALAAELRALDLTPAPTEEPDPRPGMDYTPRSSGPYGVRDLLFAAGARCGCGEPLAYPLDHDAAMRAGAWTCFAVLRREVAAYDQHATLPFAFYGVKSESSTRLGGATTRPDGSALLAVDTYACKCGRTWEDPPRPASVFAPQRGTCPACGTSATHADGSLNADVRGGCRYFVRLDPPNGSPEPG